MTKTNNTTSGSSGHVQWHPVFCAGMQIEFAAEAGMLTFETEHELSKKPMRIDMLIVKKDRDAVIRKNIGRIFRTHNIVEYKSPTDYLSIDDFYKVYGYTCFYKADTGAENEIPIDELTITLVSKNYPETLARHLVKQRGFVISEKEPGIYYVSGDIFPIQILVTGRLSPEKNLWLHSLTDTLNDTAIIQDLIADYQEHKTSTLYQSVMETIVRVNDRQFKEAKEMCDALMELFKDEFEEAEARGEARGETRGEARINSLIVALSGQGREKDIVKAAQDADYRQLLLTEFGL